MFLDFAFLIGSYLIGQQVVLDEHRKHMFVELFSESGKGIKHVGKKISCFMQCAKNKRNQISCKQC